MEIKWPNVIAFALALGALVLALKMRRELTAALAGIGDIGPGDSAEEQTLGLFVLGLVCVTIVAVVRILTHHNRSGRP